MADVCDPEWSGSAISATETLRDWASAYAEVRPLPPFISCSTQFGFIACIANCHPPIGAACTCDLRMGALARSFAGT